MRCALTIHPDSRCPAVAAIEVEVGRLGGATLALEYLLKGNIGALRMARPGTPLRADGLWRHTCFEAFVGEAGRDSYYELNFAMSLQFAVYGFESYRRGMRGVEEIELSRIVARVAEDCCEIEVQFDLGSLPDLSPGAAWRLGLSAVIEDASGDLTYWALAHPPGRPDFHHRETFGLELLPTPVKQ